LTVSTPSLKAAVLNSGRGSRPGFFEFLENVADGRQAEFLVGVFLRSQRLEQAAVADALADSLFDVGEHALDERIGFRVYRRTVEWIVAVVDAQEAGGELECFLAEARHFSERLPVGEGAVPVAVGNDVRGQGRAQSGDARQ
jgi:hypothetical protein